MNKPLIYLGGNIMGHGDNLARQEEYDQFIAEDINCDVYSPVMNKSINDKSAMTEEENNQLAEKIVAADVDRLWKSDYTVMCPEQNAIGTMCEMGILYGWKYMAEKLLDLEATFIEEHREKLKNADDKQYYQILVEMHTKIWETIFHIAQKKNYAHYFDIRTNHLNEKDWRRSFSINQFLYGICLAATADSTLHNSFDEILPLLKENIGVKNE